MKAWLALVVSYVLLVAFIIIPKLMGLEPLPMQVVFLLIPIGVALFLYRLLRDASRKKESNGELE